MLSAQIRSNPKLERTYGEFEDMFHLISIVLNCENDGTFLFDPGIDTR